MVFSFPSTTNASILSVISNLISQVKGETVLVPEYKNTQTIELLNPGTSTTASSAPEQSDSNKGKDGVLSVSAGPLRISTEDQVYIPENDEISIYTVKANDTLNSVATLFNVSVNTIVWANNLSDRKITEGQVLTILPVSGIRHTLKKGDTLKNIALKYEADVEDIAVFNGVTVETVLVAGETLLIPDGEIKEIEKKKEQKDTKKDKDTKNNKTNKQKSSIKTIIKNLIKQDGYFVRPIRGGTRTTGLHGNNAVDLAAPVGTQILAAASGKVIIVKTGGYNGGYGNYVVVSHSNGTQTLYAHTSQNDVSVGESVAQGQVIARVGSTGKSTGAHVHFEVRGGRNPF